MADVSVTDVKVLDTLQGDTFKITWEYNGTDDPAFVEFLVERQLNLGSFVELARTSFNYYVDSDAEKNVGAKYFYKVTPVVIGLSTVASAPVSWKEDPEQYYNANIIRARYMDLDWILRKGMALDVVLLKRKIHGQVCYHGSTMRSGYSDARSAVSVPPSDMLGYVPDSDQSKGSEDYEPNPPDNCEVCYGTGFIGGYEKYPARIKVSRTNPTPLAFSYKAEGFAAKNQEDWWRLPNPPIFNGDILIRSDNKRFRVTDFTESDPVNGHTIWISFNLVEVQSTDLVYRVPL